jgi:hypothetical protein
MSAGPEIKIQSEGGLIPGTWFMGCDDVQAEISPPQYPALFTYRAIEPAVTPTGGPTISHAACMRSSDKGFTGWVALEGFSFLQTPSPSAYSVAPLDVSG